MSQAPQLRWRAYTTAAGRQPVREYMRELGDVDYAAIIAAMKEVGRDGLGAARHIAGDLYEVRAYGLKAHYRLIFAQEGKRILLALDVFDKDTRRMPLAFRDRAAKRLADWRARACR